MVNKVFKSWEEVNQYHAQELDFTILGKRYAIDIESNFAWSDKGIEMQTTYVVYIAKENPNHFEIVQPCELSKLEKGMIKAEIKKHLKNSGFIKSRIEFLN